MSVKIIDWACSFTNPKNMKQYNVLYHNVKVQNRTMQNPKAQYKDNQSKITVWGQSQEMGCQSHKILSRWGSGRVGTKPGKVDGHKLDNLAVMWQIGRICDRVSKVARKNEQTVELS